MNDVVVYGDPHGEWRPLLRECRENPPEGVIILGDCDLGVPLRRQLAPLFEAGIAVRWIAGNHDKDSEEWYDRLFADHPEGNLHARSCSMGGLVFAGLGGVFKERAWYPRFEDTLPKFEGRAAFLKALPRTDRWRGGLPLRMRDAIFPEDVAALEKLRVDVMVSHEAPSSHRLGFVGVDKAARACRARLVMHGHHHEEVFGRLPDGTEVTGLAKAQVLRLSREDVP